MKTKLFCALATLALAVGASADDQLRNVQIQLKQQGFYYGDVSGQPSTETTSAIRRYQIRNGLEVTGTLNQDTLNALGMVASKAKKSAPPVNATAKAQPPVNLRRDTAAEESDKEFLRREEAKGGQSAPRGEFFAQPPATADKPIPVPPRDPSVGAQRDPSSMTRREPASIEPRNPSMVLPPAPLDAPSADFPVLFAGTPYANAPATVQRDTLRRAQGILANRGFYRDVVDGLPGPATEEALLTFQRAERMTLSGRLDLATLDELRLLPGNNNSGARIGFEMHIPHHVFRGVWVER